METTTLILIVPLLLSGIIATAMIDIWLLLLGAVGLPVTDWAMVGRWFAWLPRGRLIHRSIRATPEVPFELALGWFMHYLIGIFYAGLYLALVQGQGTLPTALGFGLATVVVPFVLLQPGLGLGLFARRTPRPWLARGISLSVHFLFGLGLWLGWVLSQLLERGQT